MLTNDVEWTSCWNLIPDVIPVISLCPAASSQNHEGSLFYSLNHFILFSFWLLGVIFFLQSRAWFSELQISFCLAALTQTPTAIALHLMMWRAWDGFLSIYLLDIFTSSSNGLIFSKMLTASEEFFLRYSSLPSELAVHALCSVKLWRTSEVFLSANITQLSAAGSSCT